MLRAVLFDLDGVLVNACDLHFEALNRALEPYGCPIPYEEHLAGFNGLPTAVKLKRLSEEGKLPLDAHEPVHQAKQKYTIELIEDRIEPDSTRSSFWRFSGCRDSRSVSVPTQSRRA